MPKQKKFSEEVEERIKIGRGGRTYNGLPSKLMNRIYDGITARDETITDQSWWAVFSLYLARTCGVIERKNKARRLNVDKITELCKASMDKEGIRNNGSKAVNIHPYSEICSCGKCHMSDLLAHAIFEAQEKKDELS